MIPSLLTTLEELADQIRALLAELMAVSKTAQRFEDIGGGMVVVITSQPFRWVPLPTGARGTQARLREMHREFEELINAALARQPDSVRKKAIAAHEGVRRVVDQDESTTFEAVTDNHSKALKALSAALGLVRDLTTAGADEALLIPDTNALYAWPALEDWAFVDCPRFCLVLVPAVVSELDRHKDGGHPIQKVVEKADRLVRQIGEYRRRGRLVDGVALRNGRSRIMAWPREPDVAGSLSWLRAENADDRLLAAAIEIARAHVDSPVGIVTRDLNLQNKCELARVSFLPPPAATP